MVKKANTAYTKTDSAGAWAVTLGAAVWGLFWIPLRYLENTGIPALWAIALVFVAAFVPSLVVTARKGELTELKSMDGWLVGTALSLSTVLYFAAVIYTDVLRAIFLFYLLPLWTTLSARILFGEPFRRSQFGIIISALIGVWLLLGGRSSIPLPNNPGDWCALGAGFCWGISLSLLRSRQETPPFASTTTAMCTGALLATFCAILLNIELSFLTPQRGNSPFSLSTITLIIAFGALMLYPSMLGQIWGARKIPAPTAALLTMTEILVATVSAAWLIGTELSLISLLGGLIIITAAGIDLLVQRKSLTKTYEETP